MRRVSSGLLESEHSFLRGEVEAVAGTSRQEFHTRIRLRLVRLKHEREVAVSGQNGLLRGRRGSRRSGTGGKKPVGICRVRNPELRGTRTRGESDGCEYHQQRDGHEHAGWRTSFSRLTAIQSHCTPPAFRDVFFRFQGEEEETAHKQHSESRPRSGLPTCHQK